MVILKDITFENLDCYRDYFVTFPLIRVTSPSVYKTAPTGRRPQVWPHIADMQRKQNETFQQHSASKDTPERSREKEHSKPCSFWDLIEAEDKKWTAALSICAHDDSSWAGYRPVMKALEISFHGLLWLAGTVTGFFITHRVQDIELFVNLFLLLILDLIVVGLSKVTFRRARPSNNKMDMFATVSVDVFSFPSGHTTRAAMVACFLIHKVISKRFAPFVIVFCCCVGVSRVMLGRHHVLDVLFGLMIGIGEYLLYLPFWLPFDLIEVWLNDIMSHLHM